MRPRVGYAFVASNPSHAGPDSPAIKNLRKWFEIIQSPAPIHFYNVSNEITPGNRPLKKSEYELGRLAGDLIGYERVVALGLTASNALKDIGVPHFRLPHPSPKNRVLNDLGHVEALLLECKRYLLGDNVVR